MPVERDDQTTDSLWHQYLTRPNEKLRSSLIENYTPLTKKIAASLYARRPDNDVAYEEYFQFGMVGLIESVDRYKNDKGATFETFAKYRIRGAILNGIEKMSERREQCAYRSRLHKERIDSIAENDDSPSETSLFHEMVEIALGMAICYMLEGTGLVQTQTNMPVDQVYHVQELSQLRDRLIEAVESLPERERLVIQHHYFNHVEFKHLTEIIGVSKGRVSQLHKRALLLLRNKLAENQLLDGYY